MQKSLHYYRFRLILAIALILFLCGCVQQKTTFEFGKKYEAKVVEVIDGDTLDVLIDKSVYRIRLLGVDCPEISKDRNKPYEYDNITDLDYLARWGVRAKRFAKELLEGKIVYVEFDELAGLKDRYGRYLA